MKTPFPQQISGSEYLINRGNGGYLYMKPRTGKTFTTQLAINFWKEYPVLIICPTSVIATWRSALVEEGVSPDSILAMDDSLKGSTKQKGEHLFFNWYNFVILNFEKVKELDVLNARSNAYKALDLEDFKVVVCDESYRISKHTANVTQYLISNPKKGQKRICLSGEPFAESTKDLATQAFFVDGAFADCMSIDHYLNRFWYYNNDRRRWYLYPENRAFHNNWVKNWLKNETFQCRLEDLGLGCKVLKQKVVIPYDEKQEYYFKWIYSTTMYRKGDKFIDMNPTLKGMFSRKVAAGISPIDSAWISDNKVDWIINFVKENKVRVLVLSDFTAPIWRLVEKGRKKGLKVEGIDGNISYGKRESIRLAFQKGELDITVSQVVPAKMGLDFSTLDNIIYLCNSLKFDDRSQSLERGQNLNRKTPYSVIDLCVEGSVDSGVVDLLDKKTKNIKLMMPKISEEVSEKWKNA